MPPLHDPMHPLKSDAPLIVYIDVKSPYGFVAIAPTLALERELEVKFDWRPLTLNIPSYLGSARKSRGEVVASTGRSERTWKAIKYSYMDARRYAERQGDILRGTEKIWDSACINIAMMWVSETAREHLPTFLTHLFPLFWDRQLDIEDPGVVEQCLEACGVSAHGFAQFAQEEGLASHDALQSELHTNGIYGVPTYVLDGEPLHGREHIPFIRWALTGKRGPAPDIAYEIAPSDTGSRSSGAKLDVYIDFKSAGSYLALEPTLDFAERTDTQISWRPFAITTRDLPPEGADVSVIESHHAARETSMRALHVKYAASRGLALEFSPTQRSANLALGTLIEIDGDPVSFIRACFAAYWKGHEDLDDPRVVSELLCASGAAHSGNLSASRARFEAAQANAEAAGIVDAPGYRISDQIFIGRQHLPWIEELSRSA